MLITLDWNEYKEAAVKAVSEGVVLLKNENNALPLRKSAAVFGRIQDSYYKSGTGSGGMVNVAEVIGITDGLKAAGIEINDNLHEIYKAWEKDNPFDHGEGWGCEPWSQKEMPLDDETVETAASESEAAVVIIGRTAGEEQDSKLEKGAYYLTDTETDMLRKVRKYFSRMIVLLNIGGIIDLSFLDKTDTSPDALMAVWQGGMYGGTGTARVLTGKVSPSGKLPDTIAFSVSDWASDRNFGDKNRTVYAEDIYTGYRYFETFAKDKVRYPFGYGLSYTSFSVECSKSDISGDKVTIYVTVTNTGNEFSGKQTVQLYCEAPQGKLGKPVRSLCAFEKTQVLAPAGSQELLFEIDISDLASYDDSGKSGYKECFVLEHGEYTIYIGTDVRSAEKCFSFTVPETRPVSHHKQLLAPRTPFRRIIPEYKDGVCTEGSEDVPMNETDTEKVILDNLPADIAYTGDKGIKLSDVKSGKNSMDEFISQLSDEDLASIIRGEGMGSPKVTPGTTSAFAGVSDPLIAFGIPSCCTSDGPSGMRLDCGTKAFSLPNGTLLASTFSRKTVNELFTYAGLEIAANKVDCLLGPGMNIHRHPLNGRNFEYFSEDPLLCGEMAVSELTGLHKAGVTGTIKHFCCNNQELGRHTNDAVVSERALREIYLKGFEIAVKKGGARTIMTSYNLVNGTWTAGNYELNTMLLRDDWGYTGVTMTDWWATVSKHGETPDKKDFAAMARAQNDMYMVCPDGSKNDDNTLSSLVSGKLKRGELQRNAKNICYFAMNTNAMNRLTGNEDHVVMINRPDEGEEVSSENVEVFRLDHELTISLESLDPKRGTNYVFITETETLGTYDVSMTASSDSGELAQIPVTLFILGIPCGNFTFSGSSGTPVTITKSTPIYSRFTTMRLYFGQGGIKPKCLTFKLKEKSEKYGNT